MHNAREKISSASIKNVNPTLTPRRFEDSAGAHATEDDFPRRYERNAYNFIQISLDDKTYKNADPYILALHLQQFSLYNIGIKSWEETAKLLKMVANHVRKLRQSSSHPIWLAIYRHLKNAPDALSAKGFARCGITDKPIESRAWVGLPDAIKFEGLVFASKYEPKLPTRLKSAKSLRAFFKNPVFMDACILSICSELDQVGRLKDIRHCMALLEETNQPLYELESIKFSGYLFSTSKYRRRLTDFDKNFKQSKELLDQTWQQAIRLPTPAISKITRFQAMENLYIERLENAEILQNEQAMATARLGWQSYLINQTNS